MTTWVLLRGLTRESRHWGSFASTFDTTVRPARVVLLDLPGNGVLHRMRSPASVPAMVSACRNQLAVQGIRGPVHLLAMSLGAMVAAHWSRVAPNEVAGCVLINTSFRPFSPVFQRLRPRNYAALALSLLPGQSAHALERRIWSMTSNHHGTTGHVVPQWVALREQWPVSAGNAMRQLAAAACFIAPSCPPPVPVLLLSSAADRLVDDRCSQAIARAWRCPHERHPTAGHDLPLDAPQWVAQSVAQWMSGRGAIGWPPERAATPPL